MCPKERRQLIPSLPLQALRQELLLCLHLSIPVLVLPPPNPENRESLPSYARAVASLLELGGEAAITRISIRLPVSDRPITLPGSAGSSASAQAAYQAEMDKKHKRRSSMGPGARTSLHGGQSTLTSPGGLNKTLAIATSNSDGSAFAWEMWDCIRSICGYHPRLSLSQLDRSETVLGKNMFDSCGTRLSSS
jgi:protein arginine N-methyltransferase 5